jgi:hypothetical protein
VRAGSEAGTLDDRLQAEWNRFFVDHMGTCRLAPPTPA